jgi:hypothetical protein
MDGKWKMVHVVLKCTMDDPSEIVYVHENLWDCKEYVNQQHIGSWEWYEIHQCFGKNKFGVSLIKDYNDEDWEEM